MTERMLGKSDHSYWSIVGANQSELEKYEQAHARLNKPKDLGTWDYCLKEHWHLNIIEQLRPIRKYCLIGMHRVHLAGRGWGKSWAGAQWLGQYAANNANYVCAVVA